MRFRFVIVTLVFTTMSLSVSAQTGDIQGTVYQRSTGRVLVDTDVHLLQTDQYQKTDENGVFQFTELPEGAYTLIVTHPSEATPTQISVDISSSNTTEVKIHLGAAFKLETVLRFTIRFSMIVSTSNPGKNRRASSIVVQISAEVRDHDGRDRGTSNNFPCHFAEDVLKLN